MDTETLLKIGALQMDLVKLRDELKYARTDAKIHRARIELAAIEAAGGTKLFGESAEIRERKLVLVGADDAECRRLDGIVLTLEAELSRKEALLERGMRMVRFWEWSIRNRLTDTLDRLAERPCLSQLGHLLENVVAEATGEKGVYAGEADWIEDHRVA